LTFKILDGHGHNSESVPSRAVAKKSTTKRPDSTMERTQDQQQACLGVVEKSQQPQGRVEVSHYIKFCFRSWLCLCLQVERMVPTLCCPLYKTTPYQLAWVNALLLSPIDVCRPFFYV